jgi:hypothetical protein
MEKNPFVTTYDVSQECTEHTGKEIQISVGKFIMNQNKTAATSRVC